MKAIIVLFVMIVAVAARAEETRMKNLISVGTDGFGWSGLGRNLDWNKNKSAGVKDNTESESAFNLNYNYIFENRVMLGGEISNKSSYSETKLASGSKFTDDTRRSRIGISVGYNFNEDLLRSWWIKGTLGGGHIYNKSKDPTATPVETKTKVTEGYFTLEGGKRISLESWGLKNVTYSPSLAITSSSYGKDAKKEGLKSSAEFRINLIKVDILF